MAVGDYLWKVPLVPKLISLSPTRADARTRAVGERQRRRQRLLEVENWTQNNNRSLNRLPPCVSGGEEVEKKTTQKATLLSHTHVRTRTDAHAEDGGGQVVPDTTSVCDAECQTHVGISSSALTHLLESHFEQM